MSNNIKKRRMYAGLKQKELAEKVGISIYRLRKHEAQQFVAPKIMLKYAEVFNVAVLQMYDL
jgi:DNA-binding XRE family transcriptional regulator